MERALRCLVCLLVAVAILSGSLFLLGIEPVQAGTVLRWVPWNGGLEGTWVTCLARDVSNGDVVAGTQSEGIYVSHDQGQNWAWLGNGLPVMSESQGIAEYAPVRALLPAAGARAMFAGTSLGLYAFDGSTWRQVTTFPRGASIRTFAVVPGEQDTILAGTEMGVVRSRDGGATWSASAELLERQSVYSFLFDPRYPRAVFCGTSGGLYHSPDLGTTWQTVNAGVQPTILIQHPTRPDTLFAACLTGLLRSFDYGTSWAVLTPPEVKGGIVGLTINPVDPSVILATCPSGSVLTRDEGRTWKWVVGPDQGLNLTTSPFADTDETSQVLAGSRTGTVLLSGSSAVRRATGLGFLTTTGIAADASLDQWYAVRSIGLFQARSAGQWILTTGSLAGSRVLALAVDPTQPAAMFAADAGSLYESSDHGRTWAQTEARMLGVVEGIACDPFVARTVYAATSKGLLKLSNDMGATWQDIGALRGTACSAVALAPSKEGAMYAVFGSAVYHSSDNGNAWARGGTMPAQATSALAVDPRDSSTVYAGTSSGAVMSQDGAETWKPWGWGLEGAMITGIVFPVRGSGGPAVSTSKGVYRLLQSTDDRPPVVTVEAPANGAVVSETNVEVRGTASDVDSGISSVVVQGKEVTTDSTGRFVVQVSLEHGVNQILIQATDLAGNTTTVQVAVTVRPTTRVLRLTIGSTVMQVVGGANVQLDAAPQILRGRTFLPIRAVVEALGGSVGWEAATQTVSISLYNGHVALRIGSSTAQVDGVSTPIDAADPKVVPVIVGGRTLLPVRFVAESLGCLVEWNAALKLVTVTYPAP